MLPVNGKEEGRRGRRKVEGTRERLAKDVRGREG